MIEIIEVKSKKELKKFVKFPLKLYKGDPNYVPPLTGDEVNFLNPFNNKHNGAFQHCKARYWLAYQDGEIVGRLGAICNKAYNKKTGRKQMRFTRYDVIDDVTVSEKLFAALKKYAKESGMNEIVGPLGFSDIDYEGLLVEGFDTPALCITMHSYPYYHQHLEQLGYQKEADWLEYRIQMPEKIDDRLDKICNKVLETRDYELKKFKNTKEMLPYVIEAIHCMNEVYSHLYGYVPLNDQQVKELKDRFKLVLKPRFAFIVTRRSDQKLIGYGLMAPNLSRAFQKARGRLFPFGIFHLLHGIKHFKVIDLYSIGVLKEYQNTGINAIILNEGIKSCIASNIQYAETGPELETNSEVQAQWKGFSRQQHKRRRIYIHKL